MYGLGNKSSNYKGAGGHIYHPDPIQSNQLRSRKESVYNIDNFVLGARDLKLEVESESFFLCWVKS